ncbi:MAG: hypothetical protein PHF53_04360 [Bacteroidales bacterium]|jgi:ornithine decarboxylase|nr:hypothetical protein [Clostridia bacterium]MDD2812627.1 hypothetical protein [Bacteroidales bacterium]MDD3092597.1 hypothetical protein [Clostridia bacterium]MDD3970577.1 hypothetical protein [Clostridia bacterium]
MNTPRYEFSETQLKNNYYQFKNTIPDVSIFYSVKCNASKFVLQVLSSLESGFEISSCLEFDKLCLLGVPSERIICGLPVKPESLITYLFERGIQYFVFDDMQEYAKLCKIAPQVKKILRLYVKDIGQHCIEYGMQYNVVLSNLMQLQNIDGLSFHISENTNIDIMLRVLDRIELILKNMPKKDSRFILNIGGSYELREDLRIYYEQLNQRLARLKKLYGLEIYAEPGASIVNTAGKVISQVVLTKVQDGFTDVYLDAGIPIGVMRPPGTIKIINHNRCMKKSKYYRFFDITSLHRLLFQKKLKWEIKEGDFVELGDYGAYTLCYRNDFHCWESPEEILTI